VAASVLPLAGCRWGPADEVDGATEVEADADKALVDKAVAAIAHQVALVESVSRDHIGLAGALASVLAAHKAHFRVLAPADPLEVATNHAVGETARAGLAKVRRREIVLQAELAGFAADAVSGTLARALASMSASIAQHLAVFPTIEEGPA
jgi:hypothetical protein